MAKFYEFRKVKQESGEVRILAKVATLHLDRSNVRTHDDRNLNEIATSLQEYGQRTPVVVNAGGVIVKGNGTYLAAKRLGWDELWVTPGCDLSYLQQRRYAIVDNRSSDLSEFDDPSLAAALEGIKEEEGDLDGTGFTDAELDDLLARAVDEPEEVVEPESEAPAELTWPGGSAPISTRESAKLDELASEHGGGTGFVTWIVKGRK